VSAVHLIRHAKAKSRLDWTEPDDARPLTKRGRREAHGLADRLRDEALVRLVSSPFVRCVQTLEPLAVAIDLPIETTELLSEGSDAPPVVDLLLSLARDGPVACCTHGDVLFDVVRTVASAGVPLDGPYDVPVASAWLLEVEGDRFTGGTFVARPPS
jgi:broad specificity phosphatase PhoE